MTFKPPADLIVSRRRFEYCNGNCNLHLTDFVDAWGNPLETELAQVYVTEYELTHATSSLSKHFPQTEDYGASGTPPDMPGAIADIVDFTDIVCFGMAADGSPFCLDYRTSIPSVIWWDDDYWRKISPTFKEFLELFSWSAPDSG